MYSLSLLRYLSRRCEVLQEVVHQQYFKMTRFTPESLILSNLQFCRPLVWGYTSLPTQEAEYSFSGFISTNNQTNKQNCLIVWDFRNAHTFSQNLFYPYNHICIFVPVHELLEYPRNFGLRPILGQ